MDFIAGILANGGSAFWREFTEDEIEHERHTEADEPRIVVESEQEGRHGSAIDQFYGGKEARQAGQGAGGQRYECDPAEAAGVGIDAGGGVERPDVEFGFSADKIVGDHDAADRPEQCAVADKPREDVAGRIGYELP